MELAEHAVRGGATLLVAVGGDGTLNEVVNGLVRAGGTAELATIPLGTGMDFVRTARRARSTSGWSGFANGAAQPRSATSRTSGASA